MVKRTNNDVYNTDERLSFYISSAYIIDCILRGLLPETAIRLAYTSPSFKTPFSVLLQNQHFMNELTREQQIFWIIRSINELTILNEKEREEYFSILEKEWDYDEFKKQFSENIEKYNNVNMQLEKMLQEQVEALKTYIDKLLSRNNELIKEVNSAIAILSQKITNLEREINTIQRQASELHLAIMKRADIRENFVINFSDKICSILANYNINDVGFQMSREEIIEKLREYDQSHFGEFVLASEDGYKRALSSILSDKVESMLENLPKEAREILKQEIINDNAAEMALNCIEAVKKDNDFNKLDALYDRAAEKTGKCQELKKEKGICEAKKNDLIAEKANLLDVKSQIDSQLSVDEDLFSKLAAQLSNFEFELSQRLPSKVTDNAEIRTAAFFKASDEPHVPSKPNDISVNDLTEEESIRPRR